ncbi:hypothetical protein F4804DRAFT_309823 [Jackrogersella minutella]|nr:hypothetical protein F4804DRAFT_309823 [Jackrogersella minutella]
MESLRKQLAETQGALHEKITQVRDLRANHTAALNTWTQEKLSYEAKLQQLEVEIQQVRQRNNATVGSGAKLSRILGDGGKSSVSFLMNEGGDDETGTIVITQSQVRDIEAKFKNGLDELAEKTKLCDSLQERLQAQGSSVKIPDLNITDDVIVKRWEELRGQIRALSMERFNQTILPKLVPERSRREFEHLSKHWKSYMSNEKLTCYLFRALIWRYLHTCLIKKYWRLWGREHGDGAANLAGFFSSKASESESDNWRVHTARLMHQISAPDPTLVTDVTNKIMDATTLFASGTDTEELKGKLLKIVTTAAELSTILVRSRYLALMSDQPGSDLTCGFQHQAALMDVKGKLSAHSVVDLMISPCLLKKEVDYSVLVKAEVIC